MKIVLHVIWFIVFGFTLTVAGKFFPIENGMFNQYFLTPFVTVIFVFLIEILFYSKWRRGEYVSFLQNKFDWHRSIILFLGGICSVAFAMIVAPFFSILAILIFPLIAFFSFVFFLFAARTIDLAEKIIVLFFEALLLVALIFIILGRLAQDKDVLFFNSSLIASEIFVKYSNIAASILIFSSVLVLVVGVFLFNKKNNSLADIDKEIALKKIGTFSFLIATICIVIGLIVYLQEYQNTNKDFDVNYLEQYVSDSSGKDKNVDGQKKDQVKNNEEVATELKRIAPLYDGPDGILSNFQEALIAIILGDDATVEQNLDWANKKIDIILSELYRVRGDSFIESHIKQKAEDLKRYKDLNNIYRNGDVYLVQERVDGAIKSMTFDEHIISIKFKDNDTYTFFSSRHEDSSLYDNFKARLNSALDSKDGTWSRIIDRRDDRYERAIFFIKNFDSIDSCKGYDFTNSKIENNIRSDNQYAYKAKLICGLNCESVSDGQYINIKTCEQAITIYGKDCENNRGMLKTIDICE